MKRVFLAMVVFTILYSRITFADDSWESGSIPQKLTLEEACRSPYKIILKFYQQNLRLKLLKKILMMYDQPIYHKLQVMLSVLLMIEVQ